MQMQMFEPEANWSPPRMDELPDWSEAKRIGIDIETCDPQLKQLGIGVRRDGFIAGVSFTIEDHRSFYLPIGHKLGDNLDPDKVMAYLRDNAKAFRGTYVGANLPYDLDYLWEQGVYSPEATYKDVQIADPLIYELHNSYSLDNIAKRHELPGKQEEALKHAAKIYRADPKRELWKLPAKHVGEYAEADSWLPLQIMRRQERMIDERDLWDVWNLECQVLPILVKLRRRGVRIDEQKLSEIEQWSHDQEQESLSRIRHYTGVNINMGDVWKPEQLLPALEYIGVEVAKTSTGAPNIDQPLLSTIDHPVAEAMLWARKTNKLRTTFAASVRRHMINGRIHCTFNQIAFENEKGEQRGARFGRLSSVDPNLQQQPARDEFAKMWRSIYLPEPGKIWACLDYSQQEPRWTTHFAAELNLDRAREAAKAYHDNPDLDNHQFMSDLTGLERKQAKDIYLGLCYGEGGAKLCRDLSLPTRWALSYRQNGRKKIEYFETQDDAFRYRQEIQDGFVFEAAGEEGQQILNQFDERAPFIRELSRRASERAAARGFIITAGGRQLHFPQRENGSYDWTHKALNRLIQGTSADQTKKALVALDRENYYVQLQVHDELDSSMESRSEAKQAAAIMQDVMKAHVPFKVDVECGPNWGEIE